MHGFFDFQLETCGSRVEDFKTIFLTKGATIFRAPQVFEDVGMAEGLLSMVLLIMICLIDLLYIDLAKPKSGAWLGPAIQLKTVVVALATLAFYA